MIIKISKKKKMAILLAIPIIVILLLTNIPAHRFNNYHIDEQGDVADEDIDILYIKSSDHGEYVLLEMKVAGKINSKRVYCISVVAKDIKNEQKEGFIYRCEYSNGSIDQYNLFSRIINEDTLQILFPKTHFYTGAYMVGLEAYTSGRDENDYCREGMERNNPIPRLLSI